MEAIIEHRWRDTKANLSGRKVEMGGGMETVEEGKRERGNEEETKRRQKRGSEEAGGIYKREEEEEQKEEEEERKADVMGGRRGPLPNTRGGGCYQANGGEAVVGPAGI